jgi:hypothetical protein
MLVNGVKQVNAVDGFARQRRETASRCWRIYALAYVPFTDVIALPVPLSTQVPLAFSLGGPGRGTPNGI